MFNSTVTNANQYDDIIFHLIEMQKWKGKITLSPGAALW